jgi:ATP-dependent protease HslVU (ClpYQ) peptidase subunit
MNEDLSSSQMTRAEQEAETEANRLIELIEGALAAVAIRTKDEADTLEAFADRIERASRDLAFAVRELAQERRSAQDEADSASAAR